MPFEIRITEMPKSHAKYLSLVLPSQTVTGAYRSCLIQGWREAVLELFLAREITFTNNMHIVYHHLEVD
jgi:hypothetical protein